jgi:signal recognition particle subunit SRP54
VQPTEILFVVDAMVGQDAVNTAQAFRDGVGFTGVVLTKLDGDARGGAALSVRYVTGQPIMYASNGEKLEDFDVFHPDRMASRILGMGDMLTLIEQAQRTFDDSEAEEMAQKLTSGKDFSLEDFLQQLQAIKRMGPITNLLGMLPGAGQMKEMISQVDDKDLDRTAAIIRGMTPAERSDPKMINGSRRLRIANGSGVAVSDVNQLVDRFFEARKMMARMAGGMGMPGGRRNVRNDRKGKKGKKGKSGGRGPTQPRTPAGFGGMPGAGFPGTMPGGLGGLPDFNPNGQQGLPDLSKLKFPKS